MQTEGAIFLVMAGGGGTRKPTKEGGTGIIQEKQQQGLGGKRGGLPRRGLWEPLQQHEANTKWISSGSSPWASRSTSLKKLRTTVGEVVLLDEFEQRISRRPNKDSDN